MNTDGNMAAIERHLADCEEHDAWQDLQDQLEAARADAKEAEAYAEELEKAMKKDWNDGTIHGWNGGDCPVHPETVVEFWMRGDGWADYCKAGELDWVHSEKSFDIIAFRVVKQHVEPKVIWVNEGKKGFKTYATEADALKYARAEHLRIAVKYVECKE